MEDQDSKIVETEDLASLEATEIEDENLEEVAGGINVICPIVNHGCPNT